ncbi:MAG: MogA/MoaB family molybdenum cofactor biosynthesis protein [Actinomycetota bacterium]|nr:MogA/MoaB family molybdenum cofactor biosynthesis protein [Actinomycetota bacterium]
MNNHFAKVLTVSDACFHGTREDTSGEALRQLLIENNYQIVDSRISPDGIEPVSEQLIEMATNFHGLIVTTGGTGFTKRDLTPEATLRVIEREAPGIAEYARSINKLGMISRGRCGIRDEALIFNVPGSPKGAREMLEAVIETIGHAIDLLQDAKSEHPKGP